MKKSYAFLLLLVLGVMIFTGVGHAQEGNVDKVATIDLRGLLLGMGSYEYEFRVSEDMTGSIQVLNWNFREDGGQENIELSTFAVAGGARKYLEGKAFDGLYIGLYGTAASINVIKPQVANAISIGFSGLAGFRWITKNGFAFDIGASLGIPVLTRISAPEIDLSDTVTFGSSGMGLTLGVGYAW